MGRKRTPAASAQNFTSALKDAALGPLEPPKLIKLTAAQRQFFDAIVASRARDEWGEAQLLVAAQLARTMDDYETEHSLLRKEGTTLVNERGTPVQNPRNMVVSELARREMALMRALRMGGDAAGDPRDEKGRRETARKARAIARDLEDEPLLA